jgi:hypothetical protein
MPDSSMNEAQAGERRIEGKIMHFGWRGSHDGRGERVEALIRWPGDHAEYMALSAKSYDNVTLTLRMPPSPDSPSEPSAPHAERMASACEQAAIEGMNIPEDVRGALMDAAAALRSAPLEQKEAGERERTLAAEILAELTRARLKFPGDNVTTLALVEEVGELAKATFEESRDRVRKEAVQVATMAMRVVLDGDSTLDHWRASKGLDALASQPEPVHWRCQACKGPLGYDPKGTAAICESCASQPEPKPE